MSKSNQEKRKISSILCAYRTIKRYRMGLYSKQSLAMSVRKKVNKGDCHDKESCI